MYYLNVREKVIKAKTMLSDHELKVDSRLIWGLGYVR